MALSCKFHVSEETVPKTLTVPEETESMPIGRIIGLSAAVPQIAAEIRNSYNPYEEKS